MKFEIGDKVKIINHDSKFYGATGTVVEACCGINYGIVSVSIYIAPGIKHDVTFGVNDLMKSNVVYEPKLKGETEMKFEIGDRVKIIDRNCKLCGAIGTVVEIMGPSIYLCFNYNNYNDGWVTKYGPYSARDLTLIRRLKPISKLTYKPKNYVDTDEKKAIDLLSGADQDGDAIFKVPLNSVYGMMDKNYRIGDFTQMFNKDNIPEIRNVYFNDPLTCVIWKDGTKTFVKNADGDHNYDPEKALAMAISKKALGNKYNYYKEFEKWLPEDDETDLLNAAEMLKKSFTSFGAVAKKYGGKAENPVEKAYSALIKVNDDPTSNDADFAAAIEEAIGYLGEALDY